MQFVSYTDTIQDKKVGRTNLSLRSRGIRLQVTQQMSLLMSLQMSLLIEELNRTEKTILAVLKTKPDASRDELAKRVSKTVRTVQRTLNSLGDKGYIGREGAKQKTVWKIKK